MDVTVEIEHRERPALVARWLSMTLFRSSPPVWPDCDGRTRMHNELPSRDTLFGAVCEIAERYGETEAVVCAHATG